MARRKYRDVAFAEDGAGDLVTVPNPEITVYEPGTTTPIVAAMYAAATGGTTLPNPFTGAADGSYEFYLDEADGQSEVKVAVDGSGAGFGTYTNDHEPISMSASGVVRTTGDQTIDGAKTFRGVASGGWGGLTINSDGSVSAGAASINSTVVFGIAATSPDSPNVLLVDYRNSGDAADGTATKFITREGYDGATAGPANNLSVVDAFLIAGTYSGTVAAGSGHGRHVGTFGLATQTARLSSAGTYANEQCGLYVINDGSSWFSPAGSGAVRANSALFMGGAHGWEWGIFHEDTDGSRLLVSDQYGNLGIRTIPTHPVTIKQASNNELGGLAAIRSDASGYAAFFMGGDNKGYLRAVVGGVAQSTAMVGGATSAPALQVDGVTGLSSPILSLSVATTVKALVDSAGELTIGNATELTGGVAINQAANNSSGGVRSYQNGSTANWAALYAGGDNNLYLESWIASAKTSSLKVGGATSASALQVSGISGLTSNLLTLDINGGSVLASVRNDGVGDFTVKGLATFVKAGAVSNADWASAPPDGAIAVDSSNGRLYFKYGNAWHYVAQTA